MRAVIPKVRTRSGAHLLNSGRQGSPKFTRAAEPVGPCELGALGAGNLRGLCGQNARALNPGDPADSARCTPGRPADSWAPGAPAAGPPCGLLGAGGSSGRGALRILRTPGRRGLQWPGAPGRRGTLRTLHAGAPCGLRGGSGLLGAGAPCGLRGVLGSWAPGDPADSARRGLLHAGPGAPVAGGSCTPGRPADSGGSGLLGAVGFWAPARRAALRTPVARGPAGRGSWAPGRPADPARCTPGDPADSARRGLLGALRILRTLRTPGVLGSCTPGRPADSGGSGLLGAVGFWAPARRAALRTPVARGPAGRGSWAPGRPADPARCTPGDPADSARRGLLGALRILRTLRTPGVLGSCTPGRPADSGEAGSVRVPACPS